MSIYSLGAKCWSEVRDGHANHAGGPYTSRGRNFFADGFTIQAIVSFRLDQHANDAALRGRNDPSNPFQICDLSQTADTDACLKLAVCAAGPSRVLFSPSHHHLRPSPTWRCRRSSSAMTRCSPKATTSFSQGCNASRAARSLPTGAVAPPPCNPTPAGHA